MKVSLERVFLIAGLSLLLIALLATIALGASPEICRPYARDLTQLLINYAWNRAYSTCLNSDDDPILPDTWRGAADVIFGDQLSTSVVLPMVRPQPLSELGVVPAIDPSDVPDDPPTRSVKPSKPVGKSGYAKGTKQWVVYCRRNYPASFRASDGTVIIKRGRKRTACPG